MSNKRIMMYIFNLNTRVFYTVLKVTSLLIYFLLVVSKVLAIYQILLFPKPLNHTTALGYSGFHALYSVLLSTPPMFSVCACFLHEPNNLDSP